MQWNNQFIDLETKEVLDEFICRCAPESRGHQLMVNGALINKGDHCYLRDGIPIEREATA